MAFRISENRFSRRHFLRMSTAAGIVGATGIAAPRISYAAQRPTITHGLQSGDIGADHGVLWSRTDQPANAIF